MNFRNRLSSLVSSLRQRRSVQTNPVVATKADLNSWYGLRLAIPGDPGRAVFSDGFGKGNQRLKLGGIFYPAKDSAGNVIRPAMKRLADQGFSRVVRKGGKRVDPRSILARARREAKSLKAEYKRVRKLIGGSRIDQLLMIDVTRLVRAGY